MFYNSKPKPKPKPKPQPQPQMIPPYNTAPGQPSPDFFKVVVNAVTAAAKHLPASSFGAQNPFSQIDDMKGLK